MRELAAPLAPDQVRRYARHILLPDFGGIGQRALLAATARLAPTPGDRAAAMVAARYLIAGGVGQVALAGADPAELGLHNPDVRVTTEAEPRDETPGPEAIVLPTTPAWWPAAVGDELARAHWRGAIAAVTWMAERANLAGAPAAVAIPAAIREHVYTHARAAYPQECCGYLTGPAPQVTGPAEEVDEAIACHNAQPTEPTRNPRTGFEIAGAELLAFARAFDGPRPPRVVYHSHPNGRAYFSLLDAELATHYPVQHLVVGVTATGVTEAALFAWSELAGAFVELVRWSPP